MTKLKFFRAGLGLWVKETAYSKRASGQLPGEPKPTDQGGGHLPGCPETPAAAARREGGGQEDIERLLGFLGTLDFC